MILNKIINSIKNALSIDNDRLHKAVSDFDLYNANTRRLHRHYENMINTIEDGEIKKSFEDAHFEDLNELYKSNIDVVKTLSECIDKRIDDLQKGKTEYAYKDKMKKSLGMSRDKMPQVDSDNITDFILHFDQKVGVSKVKRKLGQLKPAQGEINEDKLNYFLSNKKNEKVNKAKYIISNDNYLIDGHHRWAANLELKNENDNVSCYRINLPAQELIKRANKLNVTKNVDINDNALTKSLVIIALAKTQGLISDELTDIVKARVESLVPVERIKIKDGKQYSAISYVDKDVFEKGRTGIYEDNAENRRLKRVGQKYGSAGKNEPEVDKTNKKQEDNTENKPKKTVEEYAKETTDADLQNAAKGSDEELRIAAKKELERRETEHNPEEEKTTKGKDKEVKETSPKETDNKKEKKEDNSDNIEKLETLDDKIKYLQNIKYVSGKEETRIDDAYEKDDDEYEQKAVYKPIYINEYHYADNTDPDISKYDDIDEALIDSKKEGNGEPDKHYTPVGITKLALQKVWIDKIGNEVEEEGKPTSYDDFAWENKDNKFVKKFGNDSEINSHTFDAREKSAEELYDKVYFNINKDIIKEYNGLKIESNAKGKYRKIDISDKNGEEIGNIQLRIADHSYNPKNNDEDARSGKFISIEIANKNETKDKFHGSYGIQFDGENKYEDVVKELNDKIKEIIDDKFSKNDITKSSDIDLVDFETNDISKSIDIIIKALESGMIDYDKIEKAHKYIRKEPDGKGGFNYAYEEEKEISKASDNNIVSESQLKLQLD